MTAVLPEIPGYAIERPLGAGAHGRVFLARETGGLRRPVALKVFSPEFRDKYEREIEMVRRIEEVRRRERAPEIVQALGSGECGGAAFIALEYLERGSLADAVSARGPLPLAEALGHIHDAGRALAHLHREGLFHRDVKPANLILGADGRVRLSDFGLSRALSGTLSAAGSPAFAAPEVIAGRPVDGRLADVYSLGATLAFLLTGETMLPGRPDVFALERRGVPRPIQQAIVAATAADPAERVAGVDAFVAQLASPQREETSGRVKSAPPDGDAMGARGAPDRTRAREEPMRTEDLTLEDVRSPEGPRTDVGAIVSLVCALLVWPLASFPLLFASSAGTGEGSSPLLRPALLVVSLALGLEVLAFVFGFAARSRIGQSAGRLAGKGLATAAVAIAFLNLALPCLAGPFVFLSRSSPAARAPLPAPAPLQAPAITAEPTFTIDVPSRVRLGEPFRLSLALRNTTDAPIGILGVMATRGGELSLVGRHDHRARREGDGTLLFEGRLEVERAGAKDAAPEPARWVFEGDEEIVTAEVQPAHDTVRHSLTHVVVASSDERIVATLRYVRLPPGFRTYSVVDAKVAAVSGGTRDGGARVLARADARLVPFDLARLGDAPLRRVRWAGLEEAATAWATPGEGAYVPVELGLYQLGWLKADFEALPVREVRAEAMLTLER